MPFDGTLSGGVSFVTDGTTTVGGVTQLSFTGATLTNEGGGLVGISITGGGGSPGGVTGQIQFNNAGTFGGISTTGTGNAVLGTGPTISNPTLNGTISGTGVSSLFASPPAIGSTAAAAGTFTNLTANGTVSGTGITSLFASPPAIGSTAPAAGTFTNVAFGATGTISNGSTPVFSVYTASNLGSPIVIGANAGGMGAPWGPTSAWSTVGSENLLAGNNTGSWLTSIVGTQGFGITGLGQSVGSQESNGYQWTGIGNDCFRNTSGILQSVGVGQNANRNYMGYGCVAIGWQALLGNNQSIQLSGTVTNGDVISITFTSAQLTGSPITVTATATGVSTLQTLANAISTAINANATLASWFNAEVLSTTIPTVTIETSAIALGSAIPANMTYVITSSVSGSATEIVTIGVCSSSYTENIAIGYECMLGLQMTSAANNIGIGSTNLWALTTGIGNFVAGFTSANLMTTANDCVAIGRTTLQKNVSASGIIAIGNSAGQNTTQRATLVGQNSGQNLTSGVGNTGYGNSTLKGASNSTAAFCCAFGDSALLSVTTATDVCAFGYNAGASVTTGGGSILIGFQIGHTNLTTGGTNLWINAGSTPYDPTGNPSNTLWIGANNIGAITGTSLSTSGSVALAMPSGLLTLGTASTFGGALTLQGPTSGSFTLSTGATGIPKFSATAFTANGTTAVTLTALGPAGAGTTVAEWLTIVDSAGTTRYIPCF